MHQPKPCYSVIKSCMFVEKFDVSFENFWTVVSCLPAKSRWESWIFPRLISSFARQRAKIELTMMACFEWKASQFLSHVGQWRIANVSVVQMVIGGQFCGLFSFAGAWFWIDIGRLRLFCGNPFSLRFQSSSSHNPVLPSMERDNQQTWWSLAPTMIPGVKLEQPCGPKVQ